MDRQPPENPPFADADSPDAFLDALRAHPEWSERERDDTIDLMVAKFDQDQLIRAVRPRLGALGGSDGEAILRLVEAYATPELLDELAEALLPQTQLAPERAWEALSLLEGAGVLDDFPELMERLEDIEELPDEQGSLELLAEQLDGDPQGTWLALQGLGAVEPELRPQIVAGLSRVPAAGPGLVEFLRLLGFAHDPETRNAALAALAERKRDEPGVFAAWASLAADHPDPDVVASARSWLANNAAGQASRTTLARQAPFVMHSSVTALDGRGRGTILIAAQRGDTRTVALFLCDMETGIDRVTGEVASDSDPIEAFLEEYAHPAGLEVVEDRHDLAIRLLAGSLLLCGPRTTPALRYWIEEGVHHGFHGQPFPNPFPDWDPGSLRFEEVSNRARAVFDACPSWIDDSALTYEIAEEILLREGESDPDPRRDAGAYRYLFEHRLFGQLERYRRMLFWMASFWHAQGAVELGRSALALAWQLSDAQHAVPAHPFAVQLSTRSLFAAQRNLQRGVDPRRATAAPGA